MNCHIIYNYNLAQGLITGIYDVRIVLFLNPVITVICPLYPKMHTKRQYNSVSGLSVQHRRSFCKIIPTFHLLLVDSFSFVFEMFNKTIAIHYIDFVGLEPRTFKS